MNARILPIYEPATNAIAIAEPGSCPVCGPRGQALAVSVRVPVGETVACPACTRWGARWFREEIAYRWRTTGGAA